MRERPRHRLVWAVILSAAGLAAIPGCDNTVNIKTLTLSLRNIYPVGSSYTNDAGEPGATCEVNDRSFDLKLLLLGNTKERDKTLVREGDRLMNCTFTLDRGDSPCALNKRTVKITDSHAQRLSRICADDGDCGGDGWTCNTTDKVCETSLGLSVLQASSEPPRDAEFVLNGRADERRAKGRFVALLIDNSGPIRGNSSPPQGVPGSQPQTDPNDERLAAARSLLGSLDPETDRVGVWEMKGEAANVEQSLTQGFYAPNSTKVRQAIDEMRQSEGEGTPIWDAVVNAADAIRAAANLDVHIPSIIIFTDGYRMQDKTGEDAWTPYPNPGAARPCWTRSTRCSTPRTRSRCSSSTWRTCRRWPRSSAGTRTLPSWPAPAAARTIASRCPKTPRGLSRRSSSMPRSATTG